MKNVILTPREQKLIDALKSAKSTLDRHRIPVEETGLAKSAQDMFVESENIRDILFELEA